MPFLVPIFANNMARYFDSESMLYQGVSGDISEVASPGSAKAWAESIKLGSAAIFPPSVTIAAAELAMYGALAGWSTSNDSAGDMLVASIDIFYATLGLGMLPLHAAVPPMQAPISGQFSAGMDGLGHTDWATNCGNAIASWVQSGTWVNIPSGAAGPWV
mgnify:CR=1 FL=1|tara:strand:+ start:2072 stop:2551 length:480 start_codon:yes stop_codon:yes gene_type:complete